MTANQIITPISNICTQPCFSISSHEWCVCKACYMWFRIKSKLYKWKWSLDRIESWILIGGWRYVGGPNLTGGSEIKVKLSHLCVFLLLMCFRHHFLHKQATRRPQTIPYIFTVYHYIDSWYQCIHCCCHQERDSLKWIYIYNLSFIIWGVELWMCVIIRDFLRTGMTCWLGCAMVVSTLHLFTIKTDNPCLLVPWPPDSSRLAGGSGDGAVRSNVPGVKW